MVPLDTRLSVVIVSYNSASVIIDCLGDFIDTSHFDIFIVDNASPDKSAETLSARFPSTHVIPLHSNIGYGGAANQVLRQIQTPYALLLNPDISTNDQDIETLTGILEQQPDAAILAPLTDKQRASSATLTEKEWVLGAAMMFNMDIIKSLGFFDEKIFLYYEEQDLCYRARQAGYKVLQTNQVYFPHLKAQSTTPSDAIYYLRHWHIAWSSAYFFRKYSVDKGRNAPTYMLIRYFLKFVLTFNRKKSLKYRARCAGVPAYLRGDEAYTKDHKPQALSQ